MREIALRLRFRRARDWGSSRDEACRLIQTGDLAVRIKRPISPRSCLPRPLQLFHFLSETSAQANRMLWSAHPGSPNMLVRGWSSPIVGEVCGARSVAAGHFLLADDATYALSVTSPYEPQPLAIEREMERSAYRSPGEMEAGSAGEHPAGDSRLGGDGDPSGGSPSTPPPLFHRISRASPMPQKVQRSRTCRGSLTVKGRCPIHAEPTQLVCLEVRRFFARARQNKKQGLPVAQGRKEER